MIFKPLSPNEIPALIRTEEERYHDQIKDAVDLIFEKNVRFLFLAGPSCSGKSTTALEFEIALKKRGKRLFACSTDDFFFNKDRAPIREDGTPDYDAFSHTDSSLIIHCFQKMSRGEVTEIPEFDFLTGNRKESTRRVDPNEYDVFLLEGIHALNRVIVDAMPEPFLRFYLDVTEGVQNQAGGGIFTPERLRFCRRLIRDFKHRGASAELTYALWQGVLESEKKILHPFREDADMILSTVFTYELGVEKGEIIPLLAAVRESSPLYSKARAILDDLAYFPDIPETLVPENSVLREFIN